jgi:acetyl esterase/lipase
MALSFATALVFCFGAEAFEVKKDIAYGDEHPEQKLDLYLPDKSGGSPRPLAFVIHGGGWAIGDKATPREIVFCEYLAQNGVVAASVNYKLIKYEGKPWASKMLEEGWPANILDCQKALSFLLARADEYGIDASAVTPVGFSAGGHLALLLSYAQKAEWMPAASPSFKGMAGVVSCYGIHDLKKFGGSHFGKTKEEAEKNAALASPVAYLRADSPPTFVIQGGKDVTVRPEVAADFAKRLAFAGAVWHLRYLPEEAHSFSLDKNHEPLRSEVLEFIKTRRLPVENSADALLKTAEAPAKQL